MFKVGGLVSSFFQLVLEVLFELSPDAINKCLEVSEVLSEKVVELRPRDRSFAFVAALVLGPSEADGATEECGSKGGTIHPCGA